jgi:cell division protease FtsH
MSAAGAKMVVIPGSDVANLYVGVAAARIRRFFEVAGAHAPCLAAIEDVDAFALRRPGPAETSAKEQGRSEAEHALLELCHHLDGVRGLPPGVLFVATTNRPDRLDEAFTRPGRLDLHLALAMDGGAEVVAQQAPRAAV